MTEKENETAKVREGFHMRKFFAELIGERFGWFSEDAGAPFSRPSSRKSVSVSLALR
jgi:hypothetical protein